MTVLVCFHNSDTYFKVACTHTDNLLYYKTPKTEFKLCAVEK